MNKKLQMVMMVLPHIMGCLTKNVRNIIIPDIKNVLNSKHTHTKSNAFSMLLSLFPHTYTWHNIMIDIVTITPPINNQANHESLECSQPWSQWASPIFIWYFPSPMAVNHHAPTHEASANIMKPATTMIFLGCEGEALYPLYFQNMKVDQWILLNF